MVRGLIAKGKKVCVEHGRLKAFALCLCLCCARGFYAFVPFSTLDGHFPSSCPLLISVQ